MKKRLAIGIFLSLIFIYLFLWIPQVSKFFHGEKSFGEAFFGQPRIEWNAVGQALAHAHYGYILLGISLLLISLFSRAARWRIFLKPIHAPIHYWPVYSAMCIGYMLNNVLPLRMGELFRPYFLSKSENISKSSILATVVVERVLDMLAMLILLGVTIFFFPFPPEIRKALFTVGGGVILLIGLLVGLLVDNERTTRILRGFLKPLPEKISSKILEALNSFSSGLEILRSSHHYLAISLHTVFLQVCYVGSVYLTLVAFNLVRPEYPMIAASPLLASVVLLLFNTFGVAVPSAPGAVGTYHYFVYQGILLLATGSSLDGESIKNIAWIVAVTLHLAQYIPLTLLGLVCFWSQHFKISDVKAQLPHESRGEVQPPSQPE